MTLRRFQALLFVPALAACSAPEPASRGEHPAALSQAGTGTVSWKGYDWNVTTGGMAGVVQGSPSNVFVDASGGLHLKISKNGTTWTAAELYSATNLGFGTYQWQVSGPIDRMDHNVVLGMSPYGPAANIGKDGFNEIDTEFSYWNDELGHVNMDWGVYPATSAAMHFETDFFISLNGGTETTARMVWSSTQVVSSVFAGYVPIASSPPAPAQLNTYTFAPTNPQAAIPQQAIPVLLNLWCYRAPPADGNDVEVVFTDFQFVPEGTPLPEADASVDSGGETPDGSPPADAATLDGAAPPPGNLQDGAAPPPTGSADSGGTGTTTPPSSSDGGGSTNGSSGSSSGCGCRVGRTGERTPSLLACVALGAFALRSRRRRA